MTLREQMAADVDSGGVFFDTATGFAELADWNSPDGNKSLRIVWQEPWHESEPNGAFIANRELSFLVRSLSIPGMLPGQLLNRSGSTYEVARVEPDGTGVSRVFVSISGQSYSPP